MYKVRKVGDGWVVVWVDSPDDDPVPVPHLVDGQLKPYAHRQAAYRRAKQLNDAVKQVDAMIAKDGAIIL